MKTWWSLEQINKLKTRYINAGGEYAEEVEPGGVGLGLSILYDTTGKLIRERWQAIKDAEQEQREKERQKAIAYCELRKNANKILFYAADVMSQNDGKPYGTKTAQKINNQLNEYAGALGYGAYIERNDYVLPYLKIYKLGHYSEYVFYQIDFLTNDNKIKKVENLRPYDEYDANKLFDLLQDKKRQLAEQLKILTPLVDEINDLSGKLNQNKHANCNELRSLAE